MLGTRSCRPGVVNGYTQLTLYTGFFLLYVFLLLLQLEVPVSYQIDNVVRNSLLDQDSNLADVKTQVDIAYK